MFSAVIKRALKGNCCFSLLPTLSALLQVLMCEHVELAVKPTCFVPARTESFVRWMKQLFSSQSERSATKPSTRQGMECQRFIPKGCCHSLQVKNACLLLVPKLWGSEILNTTSHWSYCVGKECLKKSSQQPLQGKESSRQLGTKVKARLFA